MKRTRCIEVGVSGCFAEGQRESRRVQRGMEQLTRAQACSALAKRCGALLEKLKFGIPE